MIGLVVVLAVAAVSVLLGRANLHDAEKERLAERTRLTQSINSYVTQAYAPDTMRDDVERAPFNPATPAVNELLLQQFQVTRTGDPNVVVALFDRTGKVIASRPQKTDLRTPLLGDAWTRALAGQVAGTQAIRLHGEVLRAYAVPVGPGTPWAVLVTVPRDESGQQFQRGLGGLSARSGGFSTVDSTGTVLVSWNAAEVGTQVFGQQDVAAIRAHGLRTWTTGSGSTETVHIAAYDPVMGFAQVFTQRTDDLFDDLRQAQHTRDLIVLSVLIVAMASLGLLGWRRERTARQAKARMHALLKNAHDLVLVVDRDSTTRFVSPAIEDLLGHEADRWTGRPFLELVHPGDCARLASLVADGVDARVLNIRLRAADGSVRWFDVESSDRSDDPQLGGVLLTCHEVGERKDLQDKLSHQASHDELTGLANRAVFCDRVETVRRAVEAGSAGRFAVLFLDLDHFKPVNDTLGHDAGDQVLRTVAARFLSTVRGEDLVCRFGGDEFGILLLDSDEQLACDVAARLVRAVRAPIAVGANLVRIDASIGITLSGAVPEGPERLIRQADEAMYVAKRSGRGQYAMHRPVDAAAEPRVDEAAAAAPLAELITVPRASRAAAFARPLAEAPRRSWKTRARHRLPVLFTGALVVAIAAVGSIQEAHATASAEAHRVKDRSDVTVRVAAYSALVTAPSRVMPAVEQAPWNLSKPSANGAVLEVFSHSPAAGPNSVVALANLDGTIAASYPADATASLPASDRTWIFARKGVPMFSTLKDATGTPRAWYVLPIMRSGKPAAILLIGQSSRDAEVSKLMQAVGSLGFGAGGLSGLDSRGVAYVGWKPDLIAQQLLQPTDLVGLRTGEVGRIDRDGVVNLVTPAWQQGESSPRYIVFSQSSDVFFGDLRKGQTTRNVLLLTLVCVAVLGLGLLNRRRELAEQRSRARLRSLLHHAHDLVIALDRHDRTTFVSSAIETLLGYPSTDWVGRAFLELVAPADRERVTAALREVGSAGEADRVVTDVRLQAVDGSTRWFDVGIADLSRDPSVSGLLLTCHEIGERKRLQDELSHRARHDVLTGLANRASFVRHLAEASVSAQRYAVLFIDLDHFKPVNDRYGHDAGDAVLQAVAARLAGAVRSGPERGTDFICRLGGDEFAILLTDIDDGEARLAADRVLDAIRQPITVGPAESNTEVVIGATIGIAFADPAEPSPEGDIQPDAVVQRADSAMYAAKVAGRGRYAVFGG